VNKSSIFDTIRGKYFQSQELFPPKREFIVLQHKIFLGKSKNYEKKAF